jgi:D-alanyl-D-alanine carboxypeptidase (penicillin-binding protein 5/6)
MAQPEIHARHAILVDVDTGEVLYKKADTVPTPVASTQKLLTALIVARAGGLDAPVTIEKADTLCEPTKLDLKEGEQYPRRELLTALLVRSPNDSAMALARDNAGSVKAFAEKMNREARRLGAVGSNFVNPNGLPNKEQLSTARDMACVARAVYRTPVLRQIVQMKTYAFQHADGKTSLLTNTNRVMRAYTFCNGMKTGYTILSGHCLIASGSFGDRDVVAVVIGSDKPHVWNDAATLLEYGLGVSREQFAAAEARD